MYTHRSAFIVIDSTNSFFPGGELGVVGGFEIIPPINKFTRFLIEEKLINPKELSDGDKWETIYTRDDHDDATSPHILKWGKHSMRNTFGWEFHKDLNIYPAFSILHKGMRKRWAYSAFDRCVTINGKQITLEAYLKSRNIKTIYLAGLATDFCVRKTALDGLKKGFKVVVLTDTVRAVNLKPHAGEKALAEMQKKGAVLTNTDELIQSLSKKH